MPFTRNLHMRKTSHAVLDAMPVPKISQDGALRRVRARYACAQVRAHYLRRAHMFRVHVLIRARDVPMFTRARDLPRAPLMFANPAFALRDDPIPHSSALHDYRHDVPRFVLITVASLFTRSCSV